MSQWSLMMDAEAASAGASPGGSGGGPAMRVLILDTDPDDRELLRRELLREYPEARLHLIGSTGEFQAALRRGDYDLVITERELPWTSGVEVLRQVKSRDRFTPVIMFTASAGQEEALAAMKEGLDDFVIKSPQHFVRMRAAVYSAMQQSRERRRAAELEHRLQQLLERLNVGVFRVTMYGHLLECNRALLRILNAPNMEEAADSPALREMLWEGGEPGPIDLLRQVGDERFREFATWHDGRGRRYGVRMTHVEASGQMVIDGLVEEMPAGA